MSSTAVVGVEWPNVPIPSGGWVFGDCCSPSPENFFAFLSKKCRVLLILLRRTTCGQKPTLLDKQIEAISVHCSVG